MSDQLLHAEMDRPLWPHQERGIKGIRNLLSTGIRRPVLQAPTASGKTGIMTAITKSSRALGKRVGITVPAISLVDQTILELYNEGLEEIGVMQAQHEMTDRDQPIQVISTATLNRRETPDVDLVLVDECHIHNNRIYRWMQEEPNKVFIGFSATPWSKALASEGRWQDLVISSTIRELIQDEKLSDFKLFACSENTGIIKPDLSGVRSKKDAQTGWQDYNEKQLAQVMTGPVLVKNVVDNWIDAGEGRPTMVFCVDRAHANAVRDEFDLNGISAAYVDAFTSLKERDAIKRAMQAGKVQVVVNINCLTTGVSWNFISCIVLARPTRSEILLVQMLGRGLRLYPEKDYLLVFDHSDSTQELGLITDIYHDRLDDGKPIRRKKPEAKIMECQQCHAIIPDRQNPCMYCHGTQYRTCASCKEDVEIDIHQCPKCGFGAMARSDVNYVDGEFIEVKGQRIRPDEIRMFYRELLTHAHDKDYSSGWAFHKTKDKYGEENLPHDLRQLKPAPISDATRRYIKHLNIRHARGRGRRFNAQP